MWQQLFFLAISGMLIWLLYRSYQHKPDNFSKENIGKSLNVLGILALCLILFIWLLVLYLKQ